MAIRYYDEALVNKIKKWVKDPNLTILKPEESSRLFQMVADKQDDKPLSLPLVAISRDNDIEIKPTKQALTYDGAHVAATDKQSLVLNGIPMTMRYQLDIYTRYFSEADEYVRNFLYKLINNPNIDVEIPYNDVKIIHPSTVLVDSTVSDNSNIPERLISGQFTRMTLKLTIDDAYFFSAPYMENWKIEEDVAINAKDWNEKEK